MSTEIRPIPAGGVGPLFQTGLPAPQLFRSFWMGGFECACHINEAGKRLDMIAGVQHDSLVEHDYALLRSVGMETARDGLRWHLIDRGGHYDFSSFAPMLAAAQRHGIQVLWDICHYGWPDDLDIFSAAFVDRFARFSAAVARFVADHSGEVPFYSPINEISFFSWAAARPGMFPYAQGRDNEIKDQLIRASIAGAEAIRGVDKRARLIYPEPTVHVVAPRGRPDLTKLAAQHRAAQFDSWDMLAGRLRPELGGHPKYLDIIGSNFYSTNEWEVTAKGIRWDADPPDERWLPYHKLLIEIYERYRRPMFIAETSHIGTGRARWIREITQEIHLTRAAGIPLEGICLYPIVDRFDWSDAKHWHNSGLWDLAADGQGRYIRVINEEYARELRSSQLRLADINRR